ncbi:MAG: AAA family ATPase, partial [Bacteroidota bacterium]
MIPIRLHIEGLYSYQNAVTIQFDRLIEGNLFGIFGPVGAGKSAILEAITYALYGETERMNKQEGRGYNMMNLKSNLLRIEFEFRTGQEGEQYLFTVLRKRSGTKFEDVRTAERKAYRIEGKYKTELESTDAEAILGLSYSNFIKTIIIPQGRFQDFLHMKPAERTRMLMDLFDLDRFDLFQPTTELLSQTTKRLNELHGQLRETPEVAEEALEGMQLEMEVMEAKLAEMNLQFRQLEQEKAKMEELR